MRKARIARPGDRTEADRVQTMHVALRRGTVCEYIDTGTFSQDPGETRLKAKPVKGRPVTRVMEVVVTLVREVKAC